MEFPHLGQHCNDSSCNRLDFLPFKCDSCSKVFCSSHFGYDRHRCSGARKDLQVPVCPLCGVPVPTAPGVEPDLTVGQHIDQQCKSDTKKIFTNRCSYKNCKRKELIPVTCSQCKLNFCLRHRHTADHECASTSGGGGAAGGSASTGGSGTHLRGGVMNEAEQRKMAANAAEYRRSNKPTSLFNANPKPGVVSARAAAAQRNTAATTHVQNIQGNMTEDEALARALALSIMELDESADRNRRNAETTAAQRNNPTVPAVGGRDGGTQQTSSKDKCSLS